MSHHFDTPTAREDPRISTQLSGPSRCDRICGHEGRRCLHGAFYRRRSCAAQHSCERRGARRDEDSHLESRATGFYSSR